MKTFIAPALAVYFMFFFAACGEDPEIHLPAPPQGLSVVYISPGDGAEGISISTEINIIFNQAVKQSSINGNIKLFKIESDKQIEVSATVAYFKETFNVNIKPGKKLDLGSHYAITISEKIAAEKGGKLPAAIMQEFFTVSEASKSELVVVSVMPHNGAVDVSPTLSPHVIFNKRIDEATVEEAVSLQLFTEEGDEKGSLLPVQIETAISGENGNIITISHSAPLQKGFAYAIICSPSLKASDGVELAGELVSMFRIWTDEISQPSDDDDTAGNDDDAADDDDDADADDDAATDDDDAAADDDAADDDDAASDDDDSAEPEE